jgi:DNA-binding transcriptional ArsR family regulator
MAYLKALAALADPTRREIFEQLRSGPRAVREIADRMPVSRPAVSQHLKVLRDAGLVVDRSAGTRRVYYIDPRGLGPLRKWLDQFWDEALAAFQAEIDRSNERPAAPSQGTPDASHPHRGTGTQKRARQRRT